MPVAETASAWVRIVEEDFEKVGGLGAVLLIFFVFVVSCGFQLQ